MPDTDYRIEILCSDLESELRLERGTVQEKLGSLFEINLALYSEDREIDLAQLLGKPMGVRVETATEERFFHGVVAHFAMVGHSERFGHYHAVLRPKLWLLGHSSTVRVHQGKSVQDILEETLGNGNVDYGAIATSPAVQLDHCVQYRESDLHFVSRMMERYGLYYFHDHQDKKHDLAIASGTGGHTNVGTFASALDPKDNDEHHILEWRAAMKLQPGSYHVAGTKNLATQPVEAKAKSRFSIEAAPALEIVDFEAVNELKEPHLEELATARMQALDSAVEEYTGRSTSLELGTGVLFDLEGHPSAKQNKTYLITSAIHMLEGTPADTGSHPSEPPYTVSFTAIDSKTTFSPPVIHQKPRVYGPHLAKVTEETDEYGRVKVDLQWGNPDGTSQSCWARVSQMWAGKEWGGVHMPHKGHEVIVEFLDGDPDQPIVMGRVYNTESMPPLSLPANKSQCVIRDQGGNEILMEGADGSQKIRIYCPTHESQIVLGESIELSSASDLKNFFTGNWSAEIKGNHEEKIEGNEKRTIGQAFSQEVIGEFKMKVGLDAQDVKLGAFHETIIGVVSGFVGGQKREHVVGSEVKKVHGMVTEAIHGAIVKKSEGRTVQTYPDAMKEVKGLVLDKLDDYKSKIKGTYFLKTLKKIEEAEEIEARAKHALYEVEQTTFDGKEFTVMMSGNLAMEGKEVSFNGASSLAINSKKVSVNGGALEIK